MHAFVFPGQGSQFVGMGKELSDSFLEAKEVFQEVDDALNQSLSKVIFEGPESDLTLTENTQPALMATSIAVLRVLLKQGGNTLPDLCQFVAGHSLGEYSALCAAESISLADSARILKARGQAMQQAVPLGEGGMAAIIGLSIEDVNALVDAAANGEALNLANDNSPGQVVISGAKAAIERGEAIAKEKGAKRYLPLNVSAPFHSSLMYPAAEKMKEVLSEVTINQPLVPLVANVSAQQTTASEEIRNGLVEQVAGRVRWRESISYLAQQGVTGTIEVGAGKVLSGLTKRIERELSATSIQGPADIEKFLEQQQAA